MMSLILALFLLVVVLGTLFVIVVSWIDLVLYGSPYLLEDIRDFFVDLIEWIKRNFE